MTERNDGLNLLPVSTRVVGDVADQERLLRDEVLQLREAMETRAPVEQARGMLMMRYGLSADDASHLLLQWSSNQHVDVHVLARRVVDLLAPAGPPGRSTPQSPDPVDADVVGGP